LEEHMENENLLEEKEARLAPSSKRELPWRRDLASPKQAC
jgi:hypothetical protein